MFDINFEKSNLRRSGLEYSKISRGLFQEDLCISRALERSSRERMVFSCAMSKRNHLIKSLGEFLERKHFFDDVRVDLTMDLKQAFNSNNKDFHDLPFFLKDDSVKIQASIALTKVKAIRSSRQVYVPTAALSLGDTNGISRLMRYPTCSTGNAVFWDFKSAFESSLLEMTERQNKLLYWNGIKPKSVTETSLHDLSQFLSYNKLESQLKELDRFGSCYLLDISFIEGAYTFLLLYTSNISPFGLYFSIASACKFDPRMAIESCFEEFLLTSNSVIEMHSVDKDFDELDLDEYDKNFFGSISPSTIKLFNIRGYRRELEDFFATGNLQSYSCKELLDSLLNIGEVYNYSDKCKIGASSLHFTKVFGPSFFSGIGSLWGENPKILEIFGIKKQRKRLIPFP